MFKKTINYIILGIIQGITEPIPVSSSGHLEIFKKLFNMDVLNDLNFSIIVNFGSFLAILFLYRKTIISLIKDFFLFIKTKDDKYKDNFKYCLYIVLATIPAGILGVLFKKQIEAMSSNIKFVGIALLITALALFLVRKLDGKKDNKDMNYLDALRIGLFQVIALFPGISRSGSTIVGGLFTGLKKETAITFSFMLYIPISLATMVLGVSDLLKIPDINSYMLPYTMAAIVSMVITYFSAKVFLDIVKKNKLIYFVIYCLIVGTLVLLFL